MLVFIKALKQGIKPPNIDYITSHYCTEYNTVYDSHLDSSNSKINRREAIISLSFYDPIACYHFLLQFPFKSFPFAHIIAHTFV